MSVPSNKIPANGAARPIASLAEVSAEYRDRLMLGLSHLRYELLQCARGLFNVQSEIPDKLQRENAGLLLRNNAYVSAA